MPIFKLIIKKESDNDQKALQKINHSVFPVRSLLSCAMWTTLKCTFIAAVSKPMKNEMHTPKSSRTERNIGRCAKQFQYSQAITNKIKKLPAAEWVKHSHESTGEKKNNLVFITTFEFARFRRIYTKKSSSRISTK